jgi:hypothetical protein
LLGSSSREERRVLGVYTARRNGENEQGKERGEDCLEKSREERVALRFAWGYVLLLGERTFVFGGCPLVPSTFEWSHYYI